MRVSLRLSVSFFVSLVLAISSSILYAQPIKKSGAAVYGATKLKPNFNRLMDGGVLSVERIMSSGQLGGPLHPNAADSANSDDQHRKFAAAMDAWNSHDYKNSFRQLAEYVAHYPDGIWAGEAQLHMGCEARFNGRYTEAEEHFQNIISAYQDKPLDGARRVAEKAKSRLAVLRVMENSPDRARALFTELAGDSEDWRQRTYAAGWIQRLSRLQQSGAALANCGSQALGSVLAKMGNQEAADEVRQLTPAGTEGFSVSGLQQIAKRYGIELIALNTSVNKIAGMPLPAIAQVDRSAVAGSGHYWVIEEVDGDQIVLYDEQNKRRFRQTLAEFDREWDGNLLVFASETESLDGRLLTQAETEAIYGGCCGIQRIEDDLGLPDDDTCSSGYGCPVWRVNKSSMNLYVTDTPLWYDTPYGPGIKLTLSYNSQSALAQNEIFGNKWIHNYGSYLVVDPGQTATVFMPDGRRAVFVKNTSGTYDAPYGGTEQLAEISASHFELQLQSGDVYTYSIPAGSQSQQVFLTSITDVHGKSVTLHYDSGLKLVSIVDAQGRVTGLSYNLDGLVNQVTDPFGRSATFAYDANDNLVQITDMGGYASAIAYDADVYITEIDKPSLGVWTFDIEPSDGIDNNSNPYPAPGAAMWANYRVTITDPLNRKEEYYYNGYSGKSWHVSRKDYVDYASASVNNLTSADKTEYTYFGATGGKARLSGMVDPHGKQTHYEYDAHGNRTAIIDTNGVRTEYQYNAANQLVAVTEAAGSAEARTTTYEYLSPALSLRTRTTYPVLANGDQREIAHAYDSATNHLLQTTERSLLASAPDRVTQYTYDANGQIVTIDGPRTDIADITSLTYHDCTSVSRCGQISTSTNAAGHVTNWTDYALDGKPSRHVDANGVATTVSYDNLGRVLTYTESDTTPRTTTYTYYGVKRVDTVQTPEGLLLDYDYDAAGQAVRISDNLGNRIDQAFDGNGNLIGVDVKDAAGAIKQTGTLAYDSLNRLIQREGANGQISQYHYDGEGNLTRTTDAQGYAETRTYGPPGYLTGIQDRGAGNTALEYDPLGRLTAVTDPVGARTDYSYSIFDDLIQRISPATGTSIYTFDDAGNKRSQQDARGVVAQYQYDVLNRLVNIDFPGTTEDVAVTWDSSANATGKVSQIVDGTGSIDFSYDSDGRLAQELRQINDRYFSTAYTYNAAGQLSGVQYPSGRSVDYSYDGAGRISGISTTFGGQTETVASNLQYEPFGPLGSLVYGNGLTLNQRFDLDYRLVDKSVSGAMDLSYSYTNRDLIAGVTNALDPNDNRTYGYDVQERLAKAEGTFGSHLYVYDNNGNRRLYAEDDDLPLQSAYAANSNRLLSREADAIDFLTANGSTNVFPQPDPATSTYFYDCEPNGYLGSVWGSGPYTADSPICTAAVHAGIITLAGGGAIMVTMTGEQAAFAGSTANGVSTSSYGWFGSSFTVAPVPMNLENTSENATWSTHVTAYRGQIDRALYYTCPANGNPANIWGTTYYTDDSPICVAAVHVGVITIVDGGRIVVTMKSGQPSFTGTTANGITSSSYGSYGSSYTVEADTRPVPANDTPPVHYGYDASGNIISKNDLALTYNQAGRLSEASRPGMSATYQYNALGQRVMKSVNGVITLYHYDNAGRLIAETDGAGATLREYIYREGEPLGYVANGVLYFIHNDHLGTPQLLTDGSGVVVWRAVYEPFGQAVVNEDVDGDGTTVTLNVRFPGQYYDSETELHYNYFRYYDHSTGRYMTSDPIGLLGGINTYSYVRNNPLYWIDPLGLVNYCAGPFCSKDVGGAPITVTLDPSVDGPVDSGPGITITYPQLPPNNPLKGPKIPLPSCFPNCPPELPPPCSFPDCPPDPPLPSCPGS